MEIPHSSQQKTPGLSGERRYVTIVFADISGFTSLAETMDPEHMRELINACFEHLVPIVIEYGGTVDKFIGDEIMALFGAPVAHENDPERAIRAALLMRQALVEFNTAYRTDLGIHFGINTGLVVAGGIGTSARQDYSVMGDAVNIASRLEDASERGHIFVGPTTYRLTSQLFEFEPAGQYKLKGKTGPVKVYRLLGVRRTQAGLRALETRGIASPVVGRQAEVASLIGAVEKLRAGQGGVVSIIGEAGLGKSRLVAEVHQLYQAQDVRWLEGRALSVGQHISYWPFLEIVQSDVGIAVDDSEATRWGKLERRLRALFPDEAAEFLPYLGTLLSLKVPDAYAKRVKYLDGETMGRQVFRSMRRMVARLAHKRPLVLVFEDVHWIDQSSAALLEHLLPLVREAPLLIWVVARPDAETPAKRLTEVASHDYADCYTRVVLAPLSPAESDQLVSNLVQTDKLPPKLREAILRKVDGNPFFIEEVIRALIDLGGLVRDRGSGRWQVTVHAEDIVIPDTLQGVIMARIDRLEEEVKEVLKLAAVIGRSFFYRVLGNISEAERDLDRSLGELKELELIREKSRLPELEYIFKHALVHEATYESILLQRRKELHRRVGECIETLFAHRLEEFYSFLAYHYTRAEDWAKAQLYLFRSGDQAGKIAADAEALAHYQQAMAAYARAFGDKWDPFERATLERKMGEALFRQGKHEEGCQYLERALKTLGAPYPSSRWRVRLAIVNRVVKHIARPLWRLFTRRSSRSDPAAEELCHLYYSMSWMDYFLDPERHLLDVLLDLDVGLRWGLHANVAEGYGGAGLVCDAIGMSWLASRCHLRAVMSADELQQPATVGHAYLFVALNEHYALGKWDDALKQYRRSTAALWEAGRLREWAGASALMGTLIARRGSLGTALELGQKVANVGQDSADRQGLAWGLLLQGAILDESGRLDEAEVKLQQAVQLLKSIPDHLSVAFTIGTLARCLLRRDKMKEALAVLEEGRQLIAGHGLRGFLCVPVWTSLAHARLTMAERAEAWEKAAALKSTQQACRTAIKQGKLDCGALIGAYRVRGTYEWLRGKTDSTKWWQRSLDLAEGLGARYELGMTHFEIGKRTGNRAHLEQAESIFAEIGAQFDLAQAREALALYMQGIQKTS